jgi:excisionase family DNA binding protein
LLTQLQKQLQNGKPVATEQRPDISEHAHGEASGSRQQTSRTASHRQLSACSRIKRKNSNHNHTGGNLAAGEKLFTVQQVAENWRVSQRTIRRMIADGRLPIVRVGRAVRIPAKAVAL